MNHRTKHISFYCSIKYVGAVIYSSVFLVTVVANKTGNPTCPCLGEMTHISTPKTPDGSCLHAGIIENVQGSWDSFCYPLSYGINCASHDKNLEPLCNDPNNELDFCGEPFCFVDPSKCKFSKNDDYARSSLFPNLYYSYTTCGSSDKWSNFVVETELNGATLRVGVPALSFPAHFKMDTNGNPINAVKDINEGVGEFQGMYIELLNDVAARANFTIQYESVAAGTVKEYNGNTWSACVQDVGRGLLDLCVGNFWETTPRRQIAQFSTPIFNDFFYMVVPLPQMDSGVGAQMGKLFQPFTLTLWITVLLATIAVGFTYTVIDGKLNFSMKYFVQTITDSIYRAIMELMSGPDWGSDQPIHSKSITMTWAFFILIIVAAYTANLAAFLGENKILHKILSVSDCIDKNCNLCYLSPMTLMILEVLYPLLHRHQMVDNGPKEVPLLLANGTCDIYIGSKDSWSFIEDFWGDCETMFLGDVVLDYKVSWPVSKRVSKPISYWLGKSLGRKSFFEIQEKYLPINRCDDSRIPQEAVTSAARLSVSSMAGPLLILGGGIAFGLIYKFGKAFFKKGAQEVHKISTIRNLETDEFKGAVEDDNDLAIDS